MNVDWFATAQRYGPDREINYIKAADNEGNTALHLAVQNGCGEVNHKFVNFFIINSNRRGDDRKGVLYIPQWIPQPASFIIILNQRPL